MDTEYLEKSPSIPPSVNVQTSHPSEIDFLNMDSSGMHLIQGTFIPTSKKKLSYRNHNPNALRFKHGV